MLVASVAKAPVRVWPKKNGPIAGSESLKSRKQRLIDHGDRELGRRRAGRAGRRS